jgi:hypothetical protein
MDPATGDVVAGDWITALRPSGSSGSVTYNDTFKGGNGKDRNAMGNDGGSVTDGEKSYYAAAFETPAFWMPDSAGEYGAGKTLIEALNSWVEANDGYDAWEATGPDGYPLPVGTLTSALRK